MAESIALNCDCMEYIKTLPDNAFDLAVVDPPYRDSDDNAPYQQLRRNGKGKNLFSQDKPNKTFFQELKRVSKEQIIFGANNFEFPFKGFIVWDKNVRGSNRYSQVEIASLSDGLSTTSTIVKTNKYMPIDRINPAQKPIELYLWIFSQYAHDGDRILDTHLGSGSSRIAAYDAGLDFVGCEIDKTYFNKQEERFAAHTAQQNLFLQEGLF